MQAIKSAADRVERAAAMVFDDEVEVVEITKDVATGVSTAMDEAPMEDASPTPEPTVPEPTTVQVVDEAGIVNGKVVDPAAAELANVVKTPKATADASMVEVDVGGEYSNATCNHAYVVSALILSGLGENVEDLPPVASTEPIADVQPAPMVKKRLRVPPRSAQ